MIRFRIYSRISKLGAAACRYVRFHNISLSKMNLKFRNVTIEIAEDWFDNNISGQQGFTLDSGTAVYRKTILEADLSFAFSADTDGEFSKEQKHRFDKL